MTGLYLFAAAVGVPLVAWFLFAGDGDGGGDADGGDGGEGGDGAHGFGAIMLRLFPLSSVALAAAAFGVTGLALGAVGTAPPTTFGGAVVAAVIGMVLNGVVFAYLRRTESTVDASDDRIVGSVGRVVLPIGPGRRGRVALTVGGQKVYLSAIAHEPPQLGAGTEDANDIALDLEVDATVLVVAVRHGIATVTRVDPDLA